MQLHCRAHLERTGELRPSKAAGLCVDCLAGKPINPRIENVGCGSLPSGVGREKWLNGHRAPRDVSERCREFITALPKTDEAAWHIPDGQLGKNVARTMRLAALKLGVAIVTRTDHYARRVYVKREVIL